MALRAAYLTLHRRTGAALAADGVTADQFVVLGVLSEAQALTQTEIVERTSSDHNTLRAMLVLLENQHLIERRTHPTDRRARLVSLTSQGRRAYRRLWKHTESLRSAMLEPMSEREIDTLFTLLSRFAAALNRPRARTSATVGARSRAAGIDTDGLLP
jgi:DNA-binding MarR family transcriptional regulator